MVWTVGPCVILSRKDWITFDMECLIESWPWQISAWFSLGLCIAFLKWFCAFLFSSLICLSLPFDRFCHIRSFCHCFVEIITDTHIIFGHGLLIDYYLWIIVDIGNTAGSNFQNPSRLVATNFDTAGQPLTYLLSPYRGSRERLTSRV